MIFLVLFFFFFFQAEDGIRDDLVTGVQTCALPIYGCVISGRLSRFAVSGSTISGPEQVLVEDWCQQFPSHSIGSLVFGPDGALYVSAGDGANFNAADYGQFGGTSGSPPPTPVNPCGDPPGGAMSPPAAEGGALRSQDVRTTGGPANYRA